MKRLTLVLAAVAVAFYLGGTPALAQHGRGGGSTGHGPSAGGPSGHPGSGAEPGKPSSPSANKSVSERLADNTKLSSKIASLTNTSAQQACSGFKNLGQCVAAAHVSHNLGISFAALKAKMLGTSGGASATSKPLSLGQAIQALDPNANAKAEAKKGQRQANDDLKESSS